MEKTGLEIRGMYRDMLVGEDSRIIFDRGWKSNTIVNGCRVLLAGFMRGDGPDGILSLAVGQGDKDWDDANPNSYIPGVTADRLVSAYDPPVSINLNDMAYLDENGQAVADPTTRLKITVKLDPGYPAPIAPFSTYPLREFGLLGRFGGNDVLINCVRHPVINKDNTSTLIREIRLFF